jgi:hypothetical protein
MMHKLSLSEYLIEHKCGEEYQRIESMLTLHRRANSPFSVEFYISRGHTIEEAKQTATQLATSCNRPKTSPAYSQHWVNKGMSLEDAEARATKYRQDIGKLPTLEEFVTLHGEKIGKEKWDEYTLRIKNRFEKHKKSLSSNPTEASLLLWFKMSKVRWGNVIREFSYDDQTSYNKAVDTATKISVALYGDIIDPGRSRLGIMDGKGNWALDHKYSKYGGFRNRIHPLIVGCASNLELLSKNENMAKGAYCSISIEELLSFKTVLDDEAISKELRNKVNEIFIHKKENN